MLWFRAMPVTREPLVPRPFANIFGEKHSLLQMMAKFVCKTNKQFLKLDMTKGKGKIAEELQQFCIDYVKEK